MRSFLSLSFAWRDQSHSTVAHGSALMFIIKADSAAKLKPE